MRITDLSFMQGYIRMATDGANMGWHERNGGNLTYRLTAEEAEAQARAFGLRTAAIEPLGEGKHIFSHIEWRMQGYRLTVERGTAAGDGWVWATGAQVLGVYALPSAFRAYAARLPEWLRPKTEKKR